MCRHSMTCASRCARTFCGARRSPRPDQRAAEAVDVLKAADDFEAAAGEAGWPVGSSEPLSRGGTFPEVGANAAVEALAFSLPVGGVSDVIEAGNAAAIIQVVERQDVVPAVFDAEKEELEAEMLGQRRQPVLLVVLGERRH